MEAVLKTRGVICRAFLRCGGVMSYQWNQSLSGPFTKIG